MITRREFLAVTGTLAGGAAAQTEKYPSSTVTSTRGTPTD